MENRGSILDAIDEELSFGSDDVEMMDVEEGEVVDGQLSGQKGEGNDKELQMLPREQNSDKMARVNKKKKKKKKKKNRNKNKKQNAPRGSTGFDLDRFVIGVCKRLREKKSYLVYTAVGILGVSALSDLVDEVDAIQACGGQKTAEGNRYRSGGGILWNILKARDANAYKEIMKKGKDFEKQFRRPWTVQKPACNDNASPDEVDAVNVKKTNTADEDVDIKETAAEEQSAQPCSGQRRSVHERIRVPVSYDDLPGEG